VKNSSVGRKAMNNQSYLFIKTKIPEAKYNKQKLKQKQKTIPIKTINMKLQLSG
jgi:hypothetical protein